MSPPSSADIPQRVAEVVARVTSTSTAAKDKVWREVLDSLRQLPDAEVLDSLGVRLREVEVKVASHGYLRAELEALSSIRDLELAIAPEVVAHLPVGDRHAVLITRYRACPGERLIPANQTPGPFRAAAVEQLRKDAQTLKDHGFAHLATRGGVHWLVSSETGAIVLERWGSLNRAEPGEGEEMLRDIEKAIELHAE